MPHKSIPKERESNRIDVVLVKLGGSVVLVNQNVKRRSLIRPLTFIITSKRNRAKPFVYPDTFLEGLAEDRDDSPLTKKPTCSNEPSARAVERPLLRRSPRQPEPTGEGCEATGEALAEGQETTLSVSTSTYKCYRHM
jgi:hypothetical protein